MDFLRNISIDTLRKGDTEDDDDDDDNNNNLNNNNNKHMHKTAASLSPFTVFIV
jgi:hypothetical protein